MPNQLSPFSPNLQNRYTNNQRSRHTKFDAGMVRDVASWELPEGACYDAVDMLCDFPGKIRKRGGTTSALGTVSAGTLYVETLMGFKSSGYDGVTGMFGTTGVTGQAGYYVLDRTTGLGTQLLSLGACLVARPFQHFNYVIAPFYPSAASASTSNDIVIGGGSVRTAAPIVPTAATVTANDNRITAIAAASMNANMLGSIIALKNATPNYYIGRIVEIISTSSVRVEPTPRFAFAATTGSIGSGYWSEGGAPAAGSPIPVDSSDVISGRFGVSFQGRVVLGFTYRTQGTQAANYVKGIDPQPNRIWWSQLPTETILPSFAGVLDGDPILYPGFYTGTTATPYYNYTDIPSLGGMTGLGAMGDGQLVIFGRDKMFRLSGQLATETIANNSLSYSVDQISNNVGCINDRTIAYGPGGIIFASYDNIYLYDGSSLKPLLGSNERYYQARLRAGDTVLGGAYFVNTNHYYLSMSGTDGGLMFNMKTLAMTRQSNMKYFMGAADPQDPTIQYAAYWWDITGGGGITKFGGQLVRVDPIFLPASTNKVNSDATTLLSVVKTAAYVNGSLAANKLTADVNVTADLRGSGSPTATVKADTKLNVSDASFATLGTIPAGTAAASKSFPVGYQVAEGAAVEIQIGNDAGCDSFELLGLDFGTQQRPEEFSS